MEAKKMTFMDRTVDKALTKLFLLAEYVCNHYPFVVIEPVVPVEEKPVAQQVKCITRRPTLQRKLSCTKAKMIEGELF